VLIAVAFSAKSIQINQEKFSINCVHNTNVQDLMRLIRGQMESLIKVPEKEIAAMRIGLAHR